MGYTCPKCGTHQPIKQQLTADGSPANKADEIVMQILGCGHTYGRAEFQEYQKQAAAITVEHNKAVQDLKSKRDKLLQSAWEKMKAQVATN